VGCTSAFVAELWGVLQDLRIARDQGMQNILLQVDSEPVVKSIKEGKVGCMSRVPLVRAIIDLMKQLRPVYVIHNFIYMASLACDMEVDNMTYEEPPAPLHLISFDVKEIFTPRFITV